MAFTPIALVSRWSLLAGTLMGVMGGVAAALANPLPTVAFGLVVGMTRIRRWRRGSLSSQGTAKFASDADLARAGLLTEIGLILGRTGSMNRRSRRAAVRLLLSLRTRSDDAVRAFFDAFFGRKHRVGRFIRVRDYVHLATFAPTGRGKGQSVLKPNLLKHAGSVVVVDPDGELLRAVGEHRERAFGHRNVVLAPFGIPGRSDIVCDTLNPLNFIDADSPFFLNDCAKLASLLVIRSGKETDSHWLDSAELILTALIAFTIVAEPRPEERTFQVIRGIAASPDRFARTLDMMTKIDGYGGVIARLGNQLKWFRDRELGSVMTTLQRLTSFLDSPLVAACTGKSSFDPEILRGKASVWLILPSDRMSGLAQLMRVWVGTILTRLTRDAADESRTVLFLIDEAANIGHIHQLEEAVTLMRKRGIRLWFFFQSLGQLSQCYGERAGVFLDNIDSQQFFGLNAYESAEAISKRLGQETILVSSHNTSSGSSRQSSEGGPGSSGSNSGSGVTISEQGRALMRPEEILLLEKSAIVFHKSVPPILAELPLAHADAEFQPGKRRRQSVGVSGLFLSLSWMVGGAVLLAWGNDQARGMRMDWPVFAVPASLQASAGRLWQLAQPEEPILSEAEIAEQYQRTVTRANAWMLAQLRAGNALPYSQIPPHLRVSAIQAEKGRTIAAATLTAERQRQRLADYQAARTRLAPAGEAPAIGGN